MDQHSTLIDIINTSHSNSYDKESAMSNTILTPKILDPFTTNNEITQGFEMDFMDKDWQGKMYQNMPSSSGDMTTMEICFVITGGLCGLVIILGIIYLILYNMHMSPASERARQRRASVAE